MGKDGSGMFLSGKEAIKIVGKRWMFLGEIYGIKRQIKGKKGKRETIKEGCMKPGKF